MSVSRRRTVYLCFINWSSLTFMNLDHSICHSDRRTTVPRFTCGLHISMKKEIKTRNYPSPVVVSHAIMFWFPCSSSSKAEAG